MTPNNEIDERIRQVELELTEVKIRLNKKHDELEGLNTEISKLTECINNVTILTEKVNTTQKDMWSELKDVREKYNAELRDTRERLNEVNSVLIQHSTQFESYKDRQKSNYTMLAIFVSVLSIVVPIIMQHI